MLHAIRCLASRHGLPVPAVSWASVVDRLSADAGLMGFVLRRRRVAQLPPSARIQFRIQHSVAGTGWKRFAPIQTCVWQTNGEVDGSVFRQRDASSTPSKRDVSRKGLCAESSCNALELTLRLDQGYHNASRGLVRKPGYGAYDTIDRKMFRGGRGDDVLLALDLGVIDLAEKLECDVVFARRKPTDAGKRPHREFLEFDPNVLGEERSDEAACQSSLPSITIVRKCDTA